MAGLVRRGVGAPPYGPGRWYVVGAAFMAARRAAVIPRKPAANRRCGPGAYKMRPYNGKGRRVRL